MEFDFRRTKIIFTVGPATESEPALERIIRRGADICRINMAHASTEWTRKIIRRIRSISEKAGREIAILMDVKGPEVRTGDLDHPIELRAGDIFDLTIKPGREREGDTDGIHSVNVNYSDLINDIDVGDPVLVDNGVIRLEVISKHETYIRCRVLIPGTLGSRRHINLPGVRVNLPALSEKDKKDLAVGIEEGIDLVALSFVRDKHDVEVLRDFLNEHQSGALIIAKIEDQQAIQNLDEIILATDSLMIARGDLGIECPFEELPIIQRRAVKTCLCYGKPVIIATHMLESMIKLPLPTRAEVTDVANAVYEQADCVMLSGETSIGLYPEECVNVMDRIARRIERSGGAGFADYCELGSDKMKMLRAAVVMANELQSAGLLVFTNRGSIARGVSALRPCRSPIFAFTNTLMVSRQLRLYWGVEPFLMALEADPEATVAAAISLLKREGLVREKDRLVIVSTILIQDRLIDTVQMRIID